MTTDIDYYWGVEETKGGNEKMTVSNERNTEIAAEMANLSSILLHVEQGTYVPDAFEILAPITRESLIERIQHLLNSIK